MVTKHYITILIVIVDLPGSTCTQLLSDIIVNIVAAFRGMHVSPPKHGYA